MLPCVSLPDHRESHQACCDRCTGVPALEPDEPSSDAARDSSSVPPNQISFRANAPRLNFSDEHCSCLIQPRGHRRILVGHAIAIWLRAIGCRNSCSIEQVLRSPWNPMQGASILARRNLLVRRPRLVQRVLARQRNYTVELRIERLQPLEVNISQPLGSNLAAT